MLDDLKGPVVNLEKYSDPSFPAESGSSRLPLWNKLEIRNMVELSRCHDPGYTIYLEFDAQQALLERYKTLWTVNQCFVNNQFAFFLNVSSHSYSSRLAFMAGSCLPETSFTS